MRKPRFLLAIGIFLGMFLGAMLRNESVDAQVAPSWVRNEVTAMVVVKPDIGGFVPVQGNSIGIFWRKDQVIPICLVKPDVVGFVPLQGDPVLNRWSKDDVRPFLPVEPYLGRFVPSQSR